VVRPVGQVTGPFPKLLDLEKQVVFDLAAQLGLELTQAEREQILRQGPKSLAAFLAYSRALEAMDRGDYGAAARHFRSAAQADPGGRVSGRGAGGRVTGAPEPRGLGGVGGLLSAGARDVAPAIGDAIADVKLPTGSSSIDRRLTPGSLGLPSIASVTNGIVIIFKRPLRGGFWCGCARRRRSPRRDQRTAWAQRPEPGSCSTVT